VNYAIHFNNYVILAGIDKSNFVMDLKAGFKGTSQPV
jgi:hypothetical protein